MKHFQKNSLIAFLSMILTSCTFSANTSQQNNEEDREEAEKVTALFYAYLENKEYPKTHPFFSQRFLEVTNNTEIDKIFEDSDERLGSINKRELHEWETNISFGTNSSSNYILVYNITREKYNSLETITLEKEGSKIKILGYHIQSPGFDKVAE